MSSPQLLAQQQRQAQAGVFATGSQPPSQEFAVRPALPERDVTATTIENAYVSFIFYCNPALPLEADTETLRDAFRNPPRSGGKIFSPFVIFELVKQFYDKEIKTWTELTTKLGVEPPDPTKDESAQKIAQYGVRLKKWMNSMHVKAFFEYLMNIPNDYWTIIPNDPNPIAHPVRDGVAVEDDMALRALLPHIRPRRGRKRPDAEESTDSPAAQRQRLSPGSAIDGPQTPWSAHPDGRALSLAMDASRTSTGGWPANDTVPTPISKWPNSAVTPTSRSTFWDDALEPRSAVAPSKPKLSSHRRGPKNVSSAWKPGGPDSGSKTRGRPPINRTPVEASLPVTSWAPTPDSNPAEPNMPKENIPVPPDAVTIPPFTQAQVISVPGGSPPIPVPPTGSPASAVMGIHAAVAEGARPSRPNISLQVPQRQGGSVRLATPPPTVTVNGQQTNIPSGLPNGSQDASRAAWDPFGQPAPGGYDTSGQSVPPETSLPGSSNPRDVPLYYFENLEDRTNVDGLISYFAHVLHNSDWIDPQGNKQEVAGMNECIAMVNATVQRMYKDADSSQSFLINLAALCGAKMLMTNKPRCYRELTSEGVYTYFFDWQYRFGHLTGQFTMTHSVPIVMWKKPNSGADISLGEPSQPGHPPVEPLSQEQWQNKYKALMLELERRDREVFEMQNLVMKGLRADKNMPQR